MKIVGILGSPSVASRSGSLLQLAQSQLQSVATKLHTISVRELPAEALLHAQFDHPLIRQALNEVARARVVLVATHLLKLDYALKPVLSALGARDILDPVFATDPQIPKHETQGDPFPHRSHKEFS